MLVLLLVCLQPLKQLASIALGLDRSSAEGGSGPIAARFLSTEKARHATPRHATPRHATPRHAEVFFGSIVIRPKRILHCQDCFRTYCQELFAVAQSSFGPNDDGSKKHFHG